MTNNFLQYLKAGYCQRQYDLDKQKIEHFIDAFFRFVFFLETQRCDTHSEVESRFANFKNDFKTIISSVVNNDVEQICETFFDAVPQIYKTLEKDAQFFLESDPAAIHLEEIKVSYPGFYAIAVYRFAHQLHLQKVPLIPRIWTELAHSKTGIDIHPAANIGEHFFIDHGTGIVIGETTEIGNYVKIYQNVTLGALAVSKNIANTKRHPTIQNNVTIYASATILGGETVIGEGSIIGGNVWIIESIAPYSLVYYKDKTIVKSNDKSPEPINFSI